MDWSQSPEYVYLTTDDEKKEWKKVATDADAEKFIALFWAKRDPDIKTPQNEFRERFEALAKLADERFALGKKRGALTERGKALILIGVPKQVAQSSKSGISGAPGTVGAIGGSSATGVAVPAGEIGSGGAAAIVTQFLYEESQLPKWSDVKSLDLRFQVDVSMQTEHLVEGMSAAKRLEKKAVEMALVNPGLKEVPVYKTRAEVEAEQKAANEAAAEAAKGPALSAPVKELLEGTLQKEPFGALSLMGLAYRDGATRLMAQLFAPAAAVPAPEGAKLAILVRDKAGKDAARIEEAAGLQKTRGDWFVDRAIRALPGEYEVAAALLDASGKVLVSARRPVTVGALPPAFGVSALFVAYNDFPSEAPKADDAFTFSARKFVARGEGRLEAADGLSYAIRIYNPSVDPVTKTILVRRSMKVKPKSGPAIDVPQPPDEPAPAPDVKDAKMTLVLDLAGNIVENNLGQYFRPGEYELRFTVTDGVSGAKVEATAPFSVVGTLPAPGAAPKKK